jgi:hypothetical protein
MHPVLAMQQQQAVGSLPTAIRGLLLLRLL